MSGKSLNILGGEKYVEVQILKHLGLLHDLSASDIESLKKSLLSTLNTVGLCWSGISNKYYCENGISILDINNSNQYCQFLLILARHVKIAGSPLLADKIFGLNKMLNGCDIYHAVELPDCFFIDHSLGLIVGRASFGTRLFLSQNCTIGSNPGEPTYPTLGDDNFLMSNVTIIGDVKTGDRVVFATGSYVKNIEIPSDSIVFGRSPHNTIKTLKPDRFKVFSPFVV